MEAAYILNRTQPHVIGGLKSQSSRCNGIPVLISGPDETAMTRSDHHSDFGPAQLALFGVAAIVLLVVVWTYVYVY